VSGPATVAVIPVKRLRGALRRLAGALPAPVRRELQMAMLDDVLGACAATDALAGVVVVTSDPDAAALARARAGAAVLPDHEPPRGMNAAVVRGLEAAGRSGAGAALVLTADLPLAGAADLEAILAAGPAPGPSALLVPSRHGTGTNAMLLAPPGALEPQLGPDSLARHLAQAARRGVAARLLERPALALDVDTPRDLADLLATGAPCATRAACLRLEVGERLGAGSAR
jgi:2-phospho-L-lactate guanylyltransferase